MKKEDIVAMGFKEYPDDKHAREAYILGYAAGFGIKIGVDELKVLIKKHEDNESN